MDTTSVHPHDHDDTLDAHYSGLERLRPHACYEGVPCQRCAEVL